MYTKCVSIVPFTIVDIDFSLKLKKITDFIRGTVYTKCVLIVSVTTLDIVFSYKLKKIMTF